MAEGTGFENRQTRKGLRGSNPLASAQGDLALSSLPAQAGSLV